MWSRLASWWIFITGNLVSAWRPITMSKLQRQLESAECYASSPNRAGYIKRVAAAKIGIIASKISARCFGCVFVLNSETQHLWPSWQRRFYYSSLPVTTIRMLLFYQTSVCSLRFISYINKILINIHNLQCTASSRLHYSTAWNSVYSLSIEYRVFIEQHVTDVHANHELKAVT